MVASFTGEWDQNDPDNPDNLLSRTGFVISYAGCPIIWMSKLQTEIALLTAEAEYIAQSQAMRNVPPFVDSWPIGLHIRIQLWHT